MRRIVAGVERTWDVVCCFCLGQLGEEHNEPEQPLAIHPEARPEGWVLCSQCTIAWETLRDGSHTWVHQCPRCDTWHTWSLGKNELQMSGGRCRNASQARTRWDIWPVPCVWYDVPRPQHGSHKLKFAPRWLEIVPATKSRATHGGRNRGGIKRKVAVNDRREADVEGLSSLLCALLSRTPKENKTQVSRKGGPTSAQARICLRV